MEVRQHLSQLDLFKGLTAEQLEAITGTVTEKDYRKGELIFAEGDEGVGFYLVIRGRVKVYKLSAEGKEQIMHIFGPRMPFAEVPVFAGSRYPANAEAMESSRLFFFPKKSFITLIQENPLLAMNMLASLSQRLKQFSNLIETLSLKEVPGRLASYLLYLSDKNGSIDEFKLDIAKSQLASLLGTIPETLSRIFAKMGAREIVSIKGPEITILDREGLEDLAEGNTKL
ncbi:MAG: Crp/Fnr family transcriptional regulator [Deltaproteobacteria bacterium]|jgi:CRP/FNR family transcriptional regulator|nr:Crp/Fnr family transcriptional regulator [Deltaproteobacteria bacterium]